MPGALHQLLPINCYVSCKLAGIQRNTSGLEPRNFKVKHMPRGKQKVDFANVHFAQAALYQ